MKYENKELVKDIISKIEKLSEEKELIEALRDNGDLRVVIKNAGNTTLSTIGIGYFEHPYTIYGNDFICKILEDLHVKIGALKTKLKEL